MSIILLARYELIIIYLVFEVWAQTAGIQEISGISANVDIPCLNSDPDANVFWIINGSVYGLLQIPDEFILCKEETCNLNDLTISVVQSEMDGYTFQCVSIDYNTNTHHLGTLTELSVTTLSSSLVEAINGNLIVSKHVAIIINCIMQLLYLIQQDVMFWSCTILS